jgi:hypothetical protein
VVLVRTVHPEGLEGTVHPVVLGNEGLDLGALDLVHSYYIDIDLYIDIN